MPTAGYSGTPLPKKLGIKEGSTVHLIGAPGDFRKLLTPLPDKVKFAAQLSASTDVVHVFATRRSQLALSLASIKSKMRPDAVVWVSWPKKAAKVATDITEDVVRDVALPLGLVDIKVCAVDDVWSGLKLMIRKELR